MSNSGSSVQLEQIVRPSTNPSIRPPYPSQITSTAKPASDTPKVWGSSGNSVFDLRAQDESTVKPATWPETQRTYDVVRVKNTDDPDQHVDVEVMTEYQGRNKISQDRITLKFATNTNTDNTEVLSRGNIRKQPGT